MKEIYKDNNVEVNIRTGRLRRIFTDQIESVLKEAKRFKGLV